MVIARRLHEYGIPLRTAYTIMEFLANVALFVPLGLLLALAWPRLRMWLIIIAGLVASSTIELVQMTLPSRFPTLSDVAANTLGTAIGCAAVFLVRYLLSDDRESSLPDR
nr:VanZ family protein [Microbacterium pseudoresistens]